MLALALVAVTLQGGSCSFGTPLVQSGLNQVVNTLASLVSQAIVNTVGVGLLGLTDPAAM